MPGVLALAAIEAGLLGLSWAYHRLTDKPKETPVPEREEFAIPITEEGAAIPHLFGRARIRRPILAAHTEPTTDAVNLGSFDDGDPVNYNINMFFVLGAGFGDGTQTLHQIWHGDLALTSQNSWDTQLSDLTGEGDFETPEASVQYIFGGDAGLYGFVGGRVEFLNGNTSQLLVEQATPFNALTVAGERLSDLAGGGSTISGYRGVLSAFLYEMPLSPDGRQWCIGRTADLPAYSFEASSFPADPLHLQKVGDDCNPADVLWRILTGGMGMLGLPEAWLDYESFRAAAETLHSEGHGYSRAVTDHVTAQELLADVLRQIDAVLFVRPLTGLITLKLIRYDYNSREIPTINPDNCARLEAFEAGGLVGLPNKIRVTFTNRAYDYSQGSAQTHSFVAAVGQSAQGAEIEKDFPGCHTQALADVIAARELEAESRPITKCSAIVSRDLFEDACPGDVYWLSWPEYSTNLLMRVGNVDRMGRDDNTIKLDLIQEWFTVRRFESDGTGLPTHPGQAAE